MFKKNPQYNKPKNINNDGERGYPSSFDTEFQQVLNSGDIDQILYFIQSTGATTNVFLNSSESQETPIHLILNLDDTVLNEDQKLTIIKILVSVNSPLDLPNKDGEYPIHLALKKNYITISNYLVDQKINLNVTDKFGNTPLHYSVMVNTLECKPSYDEKNYFEFDSKQQKQVLKDAIELEKNKFIQDKLKSLDLNNFIKKVTEKIKSYYDTIEPELKIKYNKLYNDFRMSNVEITDYNKDKKIQEFLSNFFEEEYNEHKKKTESVYNSAYPYYNFLQFSELKSTFKKPSVLINDKINEYQTKVNSNKNIEGTLLTMIKKITEDKPELFMTFLYNFKPELMKYISEKIIRSRTNLIFDTKKKLDLFKLQEEPELTPGNYNLFDTSSKNVLKNYFDNNLFMIRPDFDKVINKNNDFTEPTIIKGHFESLVSPYYNNYYLKNLDNIRTNFESLLEEEDLNQILSRYNVEKNKSWEKNIYANKLTYYNINFFRKTPLEFKVNKLAFEFINHSIKDFGLLNNDSKSIPSNLYGVTWLENFVHLVSVICPVESLDRDNNTSTNFFGVFYEETFRDFNFDFPELLDSIDKCGKQDNEECKFDEDTKEALKDYIISQFTKEGHKTIKLRPLQRFYNYQTNTSTYNTISFLEMFTRTQDEYTITKNNQKDFPKKYRTNLLPEYNNDKYKNEIGKIMPNPSDNLKEPLLKTDSYMKTPLNFFTLFRFMDYLGDFLANNTFNAGSMPKIFTVPMTQWISYVDEIGKKSINRNTIEHIKNINSMTDLDKFCTSYKDSNKTMTIEPLETLFKGSEFFMDYANPGSTNIATKYPIYICLYKSLVIHFIKLVTTQFDDSFRATLKIDNLENTFDLKTMYLELFPELKSIIETKTYKQISIPDLKNLLININRVLENNMGRLSDVQFSSKEFEIKTSFRDNKTNVQSFDIEYYRKKNERYTSVRNKYQKFLEDVEKNPNLLKIINVENLYIYVSDEDIYKEFENLLRNLLSDYLTGRITDITFPKEIQINKETQINQDNIISVILTIFSTIINTFGIVYKLYNELVEYYKKIKDGLKSDTINFRVIFNNYLEYLGKLIKLFKKTMQFDVTKDNSIFENQNQQIQLVNAQLKNNMKALFASTESDLKNYNTEMINLLDISQNLNELYQLRDKYENNQPTNIYIDKCYLLPTDITIEKLLSGIAIDRMKNLSEYPVVPCNNYGFSLELNKLEELHNLLDNISNDYDSLKGEYTEDYLVLEFDKLAKIVLLDKLKEISGKNDIDFVVNLTEIITKLTSSITTTKDRLIRYDEYIKNENILNKMLANYFNNDILKYKLTCYTVSNLIKKFNKDKNFNSKNVNGMTALHLATINLNKDAVKELINNNDTLKKIKNNTGKTPLELLKANKQAYSTTNIEQILTKQISNKLAKEMNQAKYNNYVFPEINPAFDFAELNTVVGTSYKEDNKLVKNKNFKKYFDKNFKSILNILIKKLVVEFRQKSDDKIIKNLNFYRLDIIQNILSATTDEKYSPNIQDIKMKHKFTDPKYSPEILAELNTKFIDYVSEFSTKLSEQLIIAAVNYLRYKTHQKLYEEIETLLK